MSLSLLIGNVPADVKLILVCGLELLAFPEWLTKLSVRPGQ